MDEAANEVDESMLYEQLAVQVVQCWRGIAVEVHAAGATHQCVRRGQHAHPEVSVQPVLQASSLCVFPAPWGMGPCSIPSAAWAS